MVVRPRNKLQSLIQDRCGIQKHGLRRSLNPMAAVYAHITSYSFQHSSNFVTTRAHSPCHNAIHHSRTKHMKLDNFLVIKKALNKTLIVSHIPTTNEYVDVLTSYQ
ncbi:hypothetical protein QL285_039446 [Trifolium repens]|nr:hypothetical protein QL285_039446 [Trifolium repens]